MTRANAIFATHFRGDNGEFVTVKKLVINSQDVDLPGIEDAGKHAVLVMKKMVFYQVASSAELAQRCFEQILPAEIH